MSPLTELQTPRLIGRAVTPADHADLLALQQDARVMATLGGRLLTSDEVATQIARQVEHWQAHGFGIWSWRDRATGAFVGRGGVRWVELEGQPELELLYAIVADRWRQGLASEIAERVLRAAFDDLAATSAAAWTLPDNLGSQGVMRRAGMTFERQITWANLPHVLFRLTAENWRQRQDSSPRD